MAGDTEHMPPAGTAGDGDDSIERLLAHYVDRLNEGELLDPDQILFDHPRYGQALLGELEVFAGVGRRRQAQQGLAILGDYTLRRQIGRGGMGIVYEAWQNSMDRRVALKVLPAGVAADPKACVRFMREAQAAGRLSHPNVVHVHGIGIEENTPYYAMEHVEGETLAQVLKRLRAARGTADEQNAIVQRVTRLFGANEAAEAATEPDAAPCSKKSPLTAEGLTPEYCYQVARAFAGVAEGLHHAHSKGIIHRDIKPSNLILDTVGRLRVLDFGLAHFEGHESLTASGDFLGTPLYMSPEQARARKIPIDQRTDIYSLGATLYEMLTWEPPFKGKDHHDTLSQILTREPRPLHKLNPRIPKDLETIVLKCLRKDAADRYGTAEALTQDLRRCVRGDPIEARPQSSWDQTVARLRRHKKVLAVAASFFVLIICVAWLLYSSAEARRVAALTRYHSAVSDVLRKIHASQLGAKVAAGESRSLFGFSPAYTQIYLLTPAELQDLQRPVGDGSLQAAVAELAGIAEAAPQGPDAHYLLAKAYDMLGRTADARTAIGKALARDSAFVPAQVVAWQLTGTSNRKSWPAIRERLLETASPDSWQARWLQTYECNRWGTWLDAIEAYDQIIKVTRGSAEPYSGFFVDAYGGRGIARMATRDYTGAANDFSVALYLVPGLEPALLRAKAYHLDGKGERASTELKELYDNAPQQQQEEIATWIAALYAGLEEHDEALRWIDRLREYPLKDRMTAYCYYRLAKAREAIAAGRRAIQRNEGDPIAHRLLASVLLRDLWCQKGTYEARELTQALWVSQKAVALDPENAFARSILSEVERVQTLNASRRKRSHAMSRNKKIGVASLLSALLIGASGTGQASAGPADIPKGFFADNTNVGDLENVNSPCSEFAPHISCDGFMIVFSIVTSAACPPNLDVGEEGMCFATRATLDEPFGQVSNLQKLAAPGHVINSADAEHGGSMTADNRILYFASHRGGNFNIYEAIRSGPDGLFEVRPVPGTVNSNQVEWGPCISPDGRRLFFVRHPISGIGRDIYVAERQEGDDGDWYFGEPLKLGFNTTTYDETWPSISADGRMLFYSDYITNPPRLDGITIWVAPAPFDTSYNFSAVWPDSQVHDPFKMACPSISHDWPARGSKLYYLSHEPDGKSTGELWQATWYPDCNENGFDDLKDIEEGRSADVNGNDVPDECDTTFRRGDVNADGAVNIADPIALLIALFADPHAPECEDAADANDDGQIDVADAIAILMHLFVNGGPLPPPSEMPGLDPTPDNLGCERYPAAEWEHP